MPRKRGKRSKRNNFELVPVAGNTARNRPESDAERIRGRTVSPRYPTTYCRHHFLAEPLLAQYRDKYTQQQYEGLLKRLSPLAWVENEHGDTLGVIVWRINQFSYADLTLPDIKTDLDENLAATRGLRRALLSAVVEIDNKYSDTSMEEVERGEREFTLEGQVMGSIAIVSAFLAYLAADSTPLAAMFVTVTMIACLRLPALDKPSLAGSLLSAKTFNAINSNLSNFKRLCSARAACIDRNSSATGERIIPIRLSPRWVINLVSALQVLRTIPGHMFDITLVASLASAYLTLNEALEDKDVEDLVKASVELYEETRADYGSTPGTFLANMAAVLERMINLEV